MKKLIALSMIFLIAAPDLALAQGQSRRARGDDDRPAQVLRDRDGEGGRRPKAQPDRPNRPIVPVRLGQNGRRGGDPQDDARRGVREGRRVPLRDVIPQIQRRSPGRMLDSFPEEGAGGRPLYRIRWQSDSGERIDYIVDAETGAILRRE
jgi:hypothetical protein